MGEVCGVQYALDAVGCVFEEDGSVSGDAIVMPAFLKGVDDGGCTIAAVWTGLYDAYFLSDGGYGSGKMAQHEIG